MPRGFADEIAVLDGLDLGSIKQIGPGNESRINVIDPSEGGNYGGGSAFPDVGRLPLLPSSIGLAENDLINVARATGNMPPRRNVVDPGEGNYGGGASYPDEPWPLLPSNAGLAEGCGDCGCGYEGFFGSSMEIEDDRPRSQVNRVSQNFEKRAGVLDVSEGANYGGGSAFPDEGRLPLLPSTIGLAGGGLFQTIRAMTGSKKSARSVGGAIRNMGLKPVRKFSSYGPVVQALLRRRHALIVILRSTGSSTPKYKAVLVEIGKINQQLRAQGYVFRKTITSLTPGMRAGIARAFAK